MEHKNTDLKMAELYTERASGAIHEVEINNEFWRKKTTGDFSSAVRYRIKTEDLCMYAVTLSGKIEATFDDEESAASMAKKYKKHFNPKVIKLVIDKTWSQK